MIVIRGDAGDCIVDSAYFRSVEAASSEPSHSARSIDFTSTSSVQRDLLHERLKSRREDWTEKNWLEVALILVQLLTKRIDWV